MQPAGGRQRHDVQGHRRPAGARLDVQPGLADGRPLLARRLEPGAQAVEQPFTSHLQHVQARLPRRRFQEAAGLAAELHDLEVAVDHHPGRGVALQDRPADLDLQDLFLTRRLYHPRLDARQAGGALLDREGGRASQLAILLAVHAQPLVEQREQRRLCADALGLPEHEEAARLERVVEHRQQLLLQHRVHVDEDVAAEDQIQARERRVPGQVLSGKHAHVADRLADAVAAVGADEERAQAFRRYVLGDAGRIDAGAGELDGGLADVGRENLHAGVRMISLQDLGQRDRHGVGLFAGRAAGHPGPKGLVGPSIGHQRGEHLRDEALVGLRVAEEPRHVNQQILVQAPQLIAVALEEVEVGGDVGEPVQGDAAKQPPLDGGQLVVAEVDAADRPQQIEQALQLRAIDFVVVGEYRARRSWGGQLGQLGADLLRLENQVDHAGVDRRPRHAVVLCRFRSLRQRQAAAGLDVPQAGRAVAGGSGQHDPDRPIARALGERREERVDRRVAGGVGRTWREVQLGATHLHPHVGRDDVDVAGPHAHALDGLDDRHGRLRRQQRHQRALVLR